MVLTRAERRATDKQWQQFEIELAKLKGMITTTPDAVMRMSVPDRATAHAAWGLLDDDEKAMVVVSWVEPHYLSRHPSWIGKMALDPEPAQEAAPEPDGLDQLIDKVRAS